MPFSTETIAEKRKRVTLLPGLEKRLASYAMSGAAGLAFTFGSTAQAAIDYTLVKTTGGSNSTVDIDLNHDGVMDFKISDFFYTTLSAHDGVLLATALNSNAVAANYYGARALSAGQEIGPRLPFVHPPKGLPMVDVLRTESVVYSGGAFLNETNRFLGLKFDFQGSTYYGWARVDTVAKKGQITFELIDYAYQTKPNTPILAGEGIKTQAGASSLGALAFGVPGLE